MKSKVYIIWAIVLLAVNMMVFSSCEKDPWVWNTSRKPGIALAERDTVVLTFSQYSDTTWASGVISYSILGVPVDYDREILVEVVDSLTNIPSIDYSIHAVLPAGAVSGSIVVWTRRPAYKEYEDMKLWIGLRVLENEEFMPLMHSQVIFGVYVEHPKRPTWWLDNLMGKFSESSYRKLYEIYDDLYMKRPEEYRAMVDVYGRKLQNLSEWSGIYLAFQSLFRQGVLVPVFDYFTIHPDPEVDIPEWYKNK